MNIGNTIANIHIELGAKSPVELMCAGYAEPLVC
jgi:hypothetical protein